MVTVRSSKYMREEYELKHTLKRMSIRSVSTDATDKLKELNRQARMPMALLIEDGIELLWQSYIELGYDLTGNEGAD